MSSPKKYSRFFDGIVNSFDSMNNAINLAAAAEVSNPRTEYATFNTNLQNYGNLRIGNVAYSPNSQGSSNEMLEYLNAITNCGTGPVAGTNGVYNKFGKNINHLVDCGTCRQTDAWVWDIADCPLGSIPYTG